MATFDGGGLGNCTITADPSVGGIDIKAGYTGTIATSAGVNVTAYGYTQAGGTTRAGKTRTRLSESPYGCVGIRPSAIARQRSTSDIRWGGRWPIVL